MRIRWFLAICLLAWLVLLTLVACSTVSPTATLAPATPLPPIPSPTVTATPSPTPSPPIATPILISEGLTISGIVTDADGPVAGATIRVRATDNKTTTAADGSFTLGGLTASVPVSITAWAEGYYVGWISAAPGTEPVTITIKP